ncbi:MAG TPA: acylphosphatase [Oculatellaceae cyanobacterium]|jgi:acylphosphatase
MTSSFQASSQLVARRALISGKVQGVGYRYSLAQKAQELNISGWCRNLPNGQVEAWLQGSPEAMTRILEWLYVGPPHAVVEHVEIEEQSNLEPSWQEGRIFEIRR